MWPETQSTTRAAIVVRKTRILRLPLPSYIGLVDKFASEVRYVKVQRQPRWQNLCTKRCVVRSEHRVQPFS